MKADADNSNLIIETDKSFTDSLLRNLRLYKMRSKVDIKLLPEMTSIISNKLTEYEIVMNALGGTTSDTIVDCHDPRMNNFLYRILYPKNIGNYI